MLCKPRNISRRNYSFMRPTKEGIFSLTAVSIRENKMPASFVNHFKQVPKPLQIIQAKRFWAILTEDSAIPNCVWRIQIYEVAAAYTTQYGRLKVFANKSCRIQG